MCPELPELEISDNGVLKLLQSLNTNKAPGPDRIPNRILKEMAPEIAPILGAIFRQSLTQGELPSDWLSANVSSVYKKSSTQSPANYRPISLTCVSCKLLEHIICSHIHKHLERHKILTSKQHGFRTRHSCETQLLITIDELMKHHNQKHQIDLAVLDFSKAFDTIPTTTPTNGFEHNYGTDNRS